MIIINNRILGQPPIDAGLLPESVAGSVIAICAATLKSKSKRLEQ